MSFLRAYRQMRLILPPLHAARVAFRMCLLPVRR